MAIFNSYVSLPGGNGWLVTSSGGMYFVYSHKLVQDGFNIPYNSYSHWCKQIVIGHWYKVGPHANSCLFIILSD